MKICRGGKIYVLTWGELREAYEEFRKDKWYRGIEYAIEHNANNLCFDEMSRSEFMMECIQEIEDRLNDGWNNYEDYDGVVFSVAESNNVWRDD